MEFVIRFLVGGIVVSAFALLGDLISEEYGQPVMEMYREICRAFLRGLQSIPSSQEETP